jgi:hypothetical protein
MTKIQKYNFQATLPYELEVKSLDILHKSQQGLFTKPHRNNFYNVIWFQSGNPVYIVDFQRIEINVICRRGLSQKGFTGTQTRCRFGHRFTVSGFGDKKYINT